MTPEPASYLIVNHCEAKIGVIEVEVKRDAPHHNQSNGQLNNLEQKKIKNSVVSVEKHRVKTPNNENSSLCVTQKVGGNTVRSKKESVPQI